MKTRLSFSLAVAALAASSSAAWAGSATVDGKFGGVGDNYTNSWTVAKTGAAGYISGPVPNAMLYASQDASNNLYIALVLPRAYCDNSYGGNPDGVGGNTYTSSNWLNSAHTTHSLTELLGSDRAALSFFKNNSGTAFFSGEMDYATLSGSAISSLGFTGGDGSLQNAGMAAMVLGAQSSLGYNFNTFGFNNFDTNSDNKLDNNDHSPEIVEGTYNVTNAAFSNWQFDIVYEFEIRGSDVGGVVLDSTGFINGFSMGLTLVHASPNTTNSNSNGFGGTITPTSIVVPLHPAVWMGGVMMVLLAAHQVLRRRRAALTL